MTILCHIYGIVEAKKGVITSMGKLTQRKFVTSLTLIFNSIYSASVFRKI